MMTQSEAIALQKRIERTYQTLIRAVRADKSPKVREALATSYIKLVDKMLDYKRAKYDSK